MARSIPLVLFAAHARPAVAGPQSVLDSATENAARIEGIAWVLFAGGAAIFVAVLVLAWIALFGTAAQRAAIGRKALVTGAGIVFPVVVLTALLIYTFMSAAAIVTPSAPSSIRVEVTGELWWWRVRYLDEDGGTMVETANEIRLPAAQPVEFLLKSPDVIHSFWVPNLAGKIDMIPGRVNRLWITAQDLGTFRGQCAEFCGAQHAKMALHVVVQTPDEFRTWLASHLPPALVPRDPQLLRGRQLFLESRCGLCHTVRGTPAKGTSGPDLTHVGSRQWIAAGTLPNGAGALAGWITDTQHVKPDSRMPSFRQFSADDLRALAAFLESLQ